MNDMIMALLASLSHSFGGSLGWAIIVFSLGVRVALLPLTLSLARRAQRRQEILQRLQPEIDRLRQRYAKNPQRLWEEARRLYKEHDCSPLDIPTLVGSFIQLPIFGIVYSAIRNSLRSSGPFLWMRNLASPDFLLTLVILFLTGVSAYFMPASSEQMRSTLIALQVVVTFFIVWKLAAGLGLYWASSSLVGVVQTLWLRYRYAGARKA